MRLLRNQNVHLARSPTLDRSKVRDQMKGPQGCEVGKLGTRGLGVRLATSPRNSVYAEKPSDGCPINKLEDAHTYKTTDEIVISYILLITFLGKGRNFHIRITHTSTGLAYTASVLEPN